MPKTGAYPEGVAVVGGGRWARVLTEVLCSLVPPSVTLSIHSRHNSETVLAWLRARGLERRVELFSDWVPSRLSRSCAAIVVNAARDHAEAVEKALYARVPVLVEKPIALRSETARRLAALAHQQGVRFAPAHVFLFASYLQEFARQVGAVGPIDSLYVRWTDPVLEERYGESKRYDAGLPVFADWLPHIVPIVGAVVGTLPDRICGLNVRNGGAFLDLSVMAGNTKCQIHLQRNAKERMRVLRASAGSMVFELDFSTEPGTIAYRGSAFSADPDWGSRRRPVASMLNAFLEGVAGGNWDPRLDGSAGLRSCEISDHTADKYYAELLPWIYRKLGADESVGENLRYALTELISAKGMVSSVELDALINMVKSQFVGSEETKQIRELGLSCDPTIWVNFFAELRAIP